MFHFVDMENVVENVTVKRGFILKALELSKEYGDARNTMFVIGIDGTADVEAYVVRMDTDIIMVDDVRYMNEENFSNFILHETEGGEYIRVVVESGTRYPNWLEHLKQSYTSIDLRMAMDAKNQNYRINLCDALRSLGHQIVFSGQCILMREYPGNSLVSFRIESGEILVKGPNDYSKWVRDVKLEECMEYYNSTFEELSRVLSIMVPDLNSVAKGYVEQLKTLDIVKAVHVIPDTPIIKLTSHNGLSVKILLSKFNDETVVLYGPSRPDSRIVLPNNVTKDEVYILMKVLLTTVQGFRTKEQSNKDLTKNNFNEDKTTQTTTANFGVGKNDKNIVQGEGSTIFEIQQMNVGDVKSKVLVGEITTKEK